MTVTAEMATAGAGVVLEKTFARNGMEATMTWSPENGVRVRLEERHDLSPQMMLNYASFLGEIVNYQAPEWDIANQKNFVPLDEYGLFQIINDETGEEFWVSDRNTSPLDFGTPILSWGVQSYSEGSRPCVTLTLDAVGVVPHANPLRISAEWNDREGIERLVARAHSGHAYQTELALMNSTYISRAATVWAEDARAREFSAELPRSAHIRHSRLARVLRERHPNSSSRHARGYLYMIDFPGTRIVPIIALRRFDSTAIRSTLEGEGLVPFPINPLSNHAFWNVTVPNQWTFWVAEPSIFDANDTNLIGWLDRTIQRNCSSYTNKRRYPI